MHEAIHANVAIVSLAYKGETVQMTLGEKAKD